MQTQNPTAAKFACAKCKRTFDWDPQHVGRLAQCPCGNTMKVPRLPATALVKALKPGGLPRQAPQRSPAATLPPPLPGMPPLTGDSAATPNTPPPLPPQPMTPFIPGQSLIHDPGADKLDADIEAELAATGAYAEHEGEAKPDPFRDLHLPLGLLGVGGLLVIAQVVLVATQSRAAAVGVIIGTAVSLVINVALMLGGVLLAARFAGISFGEFKTALLKLCAIYVAPTFLGQLMTQALGGNAAVACIGWGVSVICYWGLTSYLFQLDGAQTMTCVTAISIVRFLAHFVVGAVMMIAVVSTVDDRIEDLTPEQEEAEVADLDEE